MNSLSVALTVCLFGLALSELTDQTVSTLTACKLNKAAKFVQLKCDVGEALDESVAAAIIKGKKGATTTIITTKQLEYVYGNSVTVVLEKSEAEGKELTCQVKQVKTTAVSKAVTIADNEAKNLELCSSAAPRIVNSISVPLLCFMAAFIKSSY